MTSSRVYCSFTSKTHFLTGSTGFTGFLCYFQIPDEFENGVVRFAEMVHLSSNVRGLALPVYNPVRGRVSFAEGNEPMLSAIRAVSIGF
jgi:hypothetical protein